MEFDDKVDNKGENSKEDEDETRRESITSIENVAKLGLQKNANRLSGLYQEISEERQQEVQMEFEENEIEQEKAEKLQIKIQLSRDAATASFNDSINFGQKNSDLTFGNDMAKNGDQSCRNSQMLKNSFDSPSPIKINQLHKDSNSAIKDGLKGLITSGVS